MVGSTVPTKNTASASGAAIAICPGLRAKKPGNVASSTALSITATTTMTRTSLRQSVERRLSCSAE